MRAAGVGPHVPPAPSQFSPLLLGPHLPSLPTTRWAPHVSDGTRVTRVGLSVRHVFHFNRVAVARWGPRRSIPRTIEASLTGRPGWGGDHLQGGALSFCCQMVGTHGDASPVSLRSFFFLAAVWFCRKVAVLMLVPFIYHGKLKAFLGLIRAGIIANYKLAINIF